MQIAWDMLNIGTINLSLEGRCTILGKSLIGLFGGRDCELQTH
jgi:hypothetical protein